MIAALYIDPLGPYPKMTGIDCWDVKRDARKYAGPHPVVAHPPCGSWSVMSHRTKQGFSDCGPIAFGQVRLFGGVLEQPAYSKLFDACFAPSPGEYDERGFTEEVEQVAWGHVARKKTWLYFVGVDRSLVLRTIRRGGTPTHWVSGVRASSKGGSSNVPPGIKVCSAQMRRRTPTLFAEWLVTLARSVESA